MKLRPRDCQGAAMPAMVKSVAICCVLPFQSMKQRYNEKCYLFLVGVPVDALPAMDSDLPCRPPPALDSQPVVQYVLWSSLQLKPAQFSYINLVNVQLLSSLTRALLPRPSTPDRSQPTAPSTQNLATVYYPCNSLPTAPFSTKQYPHRRHSATAVHCCPSSSQASMQW